MSAYFDSCASHNFVSTKFAAELIARGARYRRCELPIMQGALRAGVSRIKLLADIIVSSEGNLHHLSQEVFWVWDMGVDMVLSHSLMKDENIKPQGSQHDGLLLEPFVTRRGEFLTGEGEELLLQHLQERSNYARHCLVAPASVCSVAQSGPPVPDELVDQDEHENLVKLFAKTISRETSQARQDSWSIEKIIEIRRLLLSQLQTPDAECLKRLNEIKAAYTDAFGEDISRPCTLKKFEIKLKSGFKYYCFLPRRVSEPVLAQMREQIEALLAQGIIEECADSPFAFPIVMVKRVGSPKLRLCLDYKLQNDQTEPFPFPIPDIREQLDRLAGKQFYCSLDCASFFHEFEIVEEHRAFTAFVTPWGQKLQWRRVPFGLKNAPAHCQKQFQELLAKSGNPLLQDIIPYFDDCAFGANSIDELCLKFEALLAIAVKHGLKFKESKCVLGTRAISHLGFIVNSDGIHIDPRRIDRLLRMSAAKDVDDIRHILGAFGFCRAWLADSASITAPLTDLLKKDCPFAWGPKQQRALDRLKTAIVVAPCLAGAINSLYPVYGRTDASILGVAAVLFQFLPSGKRDADGNEILLPKAIAFASRRFSPTEFRWTVNDKEHYSLKFFFEKFGDLVYGHDIRLQTDHRNSLWMSTSASPKVIRWRLFMNRWSFTLSHIPGKDNGTSDALSRKLDEMSDDEFDTYLSRLHISNMQESAPSDAQANEWRGDPEGLDIDEDAMDSDLPADFHAVLVAAVCELEKRDRAGPSVSTDSVAKFNQVVQAAKAAAEASLAPIASEASQEASPILENFELPPVVNPDRSAVRVADQPEWVDLGEEEVELDRDQQPPPQQNFPFNVALRADIARVHSDTVGHVGALKTYRRLRMLQDQPWALTASQIQSEISRFIAACPTCQKSSSFSRDFESSGRWIRQPPFREISIDVIEMPFPDRDGNVKVLAIIDSFSRALELFPLPHADAIRVAECLFAVYCRYYRTAVVRCDNAKAFVGSVLRQLLELLGAHTHPVPAYAHWQNGQIERSHHEVMRHLRALILSGVGGVHSERRWGTLLHGARRIIMNTVCSSSGVAPNDLVFGGFADSDEALFQEPLPKFSSSDQPEAFVLELQNEQVRLLARAEDYQQARFNYMISKSEDQGDLALPEGTWVLCYRGGLPHGRPRDKLQLPWTGPWRVLDREGDDANPKVRVIHAATRRVEVFGRRELRAFNVEHMDGPDDFAKVAERDYWDYSVDAILDHSPPGARRLASRRLRKKNDYKFLVRYKFLPLSDEPGCENPSWQPYECVWNTSALKDYCDRPEVTALLGADFCVGDDI